MLVAPLFVACTAESPRDLGDRADTTDPHRLESPPTSVPQDSVDSPMLDAARDASVASERIPSAFARWEPSLRKSGRRELRAVITPTWSYVSSLEDTLLLMPGSLVLTKELLLVADRGSKRLIGFRRRDGQLEWIAGREGSGPGEFRQPIVVPDGERSVLVVDFGTRRLSTWDDAGTMSMERDLASIGLVMSTCRVRDSSFLFKVRPSGTLSRDGLGELSPGSDTLRNLRALPIAAPPHRTGLGGDARVVRAEDGVCLVAPSYYPWVGVYAPDGALDTVPLIEWVPPPIIVENPRDSRSSVSFVSSDTPLLTVGLAATREHMFVITYGRTEQRFRILDVYARRPWQYLGSLLTHGRLISIAAADSTLATISEDSSGYHRVDVSTLRQLRP